MQLPDAIRLIEPAFLNEAMPSVWGELGCGTGLFTTALAEVLKNSSIIYAVDKEESSLADIQLKTGIRLVKMVADFNDHNFTMPSVDGLLMANSLHYVQDKENFIRKTKSWLNSEGRFLLIEYDTEHGNPWVPYPISFRKAKELFKALCFSGFEKIGARSSVYQRGGMYVAIASV